ncbi:MAG: hypothetical protein ACPGU4_13515, partial [Flavobacteriales bacterium]
MKRILCLLFLPLSLLAQENLDSLIALPYDEMVSDLSASKTRLDAGLESAIEAKNELAIAEIYSKLNIVTYLQGELDVALDYGIKAIELFEHLNMPNRVGGLYCSIGYSLKRRDMNEANRYMRTGLSILKKLDDAVQLETGNNNYGVLKEMENQLDSANFYYNLALETAIARNDSIAIPYALNNLAGVAVMTEDFPSAKQYFSRAYQIRKLRNEAYGILENTIYFGDYFSAVSQTDSAIFYYRDAIDQSYKVGYPYMRQYCFEQLALVYELDGNATEALAAQKMYSAIKDSLITEKRTEQLAEMETRFKTTQKEKENLVLKQETQEQQLVVSRQRNWIIGIGSGALILLFLGLFILQRNKRLAEA